MAWKCPWSEFVCIFFVVKIWEFFTSLFIFWRSERKKKTFYLDPKAAEGHFLSFLFVLQKFCNSTQPSASSVAACININYSSKVFTKSQTTNSRHKTGFLKYSKLRELLIKDFKHHFKFFSILFSWNFWNRNENHDKGKRSGIVTPFKANS